MTEAETKERQAAVAEDLTTIAASHPPSELRRLGFHELLQSAADLIHSGRAQAAQELYKRALTLATEARDSELADLARCHLCETRIILGQPIDEPVAELRQILVRAGQGAAGLEAAYNISYAYELAKDFKKALFYARIARDRASAVGREDWLASTSNQIGNCLVGESQFEAAEEFYRRALSLLADREGVKAAWILSSLGYCRVKLGAPREGVALALRALRLCRRLSQAGYEFWPRLQLCYGYLELGRLERSRRHGARALEIAETSDNPDWIKSSLFLMGEVERDAGRTEHAHELFDRLQKSFYPSQPWLVDLLFANELRNAVNLRA